MDISRITAFSHTAATSNITVSYGARDLPSSQPWEGCEQGRAHNGAHARATRVPWAQQYAGALAPARLRRRGGASAASLLPTAAVAAPSWASGRGVSAGGELAAYPSASFPTPVPCADIDTQVEL